MSRASALLVLASLLLAGCLGDDEEPLEQESLEKDGVDLGGDNDGRPIDEPDAGICVIGIKSPCNGPEWEDPCVADPIMMMKRATVAWSGPEDLQAGDELTFEIRLTVDAADVQWRVDQAPAGNGTELTHAWTHAGAHLLEVEATDDCGRTIAHAAYRIGVDLNRTWEGTVVVADDGACLAPPYSCGNHSLDLPASATSLRLVLDRPEDPARDGITLTATGPDGADAGTGTDLRIDAPRFGAWNLTVGGTGAAAPYTLTALASFPDDRAGMPRIQGT